MRNGPPLQPVELPQRQGSIIGTKKQLLLSPKNKNLYNYDYFENIKTNY